MNDDDEILRQDAEDACRVWGIDVPPGASYAQLTALLTAVMTGKAEPLTEEAPTIGSA